MKMFMVALNQMSYFNLKPILILIAMDATTIIYRKYSLPASVNPQKQLYWTSELTPNVSCDFISFFFTLSRDPNEFGKT